MLGAGIDPRMFVQDYSGFAEAAKIRAQGMQNLGADIGNIGKQFGEFKKEQAEQEKQVKSAELVAKAISDSFPSLAPMAQEAMFILGDKNNPLSDRLAAARAIEKSLKIGSGLLAKQAEQGLASQKMAMQMEEQQRRANEIAGIENIYRGDEVVQMGRTRSGQLIPIGEMVQNALPQDETLQPLPDDLLTEADENGVPFEMGVSVGNEPGVLPPKPGSQLGVGPRYRESAQQTSLTKEEVDKARKEGASVSGKLNPDGSMTNATITYRAEKEEKPSQIKQREEAFNRARQLYNEGKDAEAVSIANAAGGRGLLGMMTIDDLPSIFGEREVATTERPPISDILE